MLFTDSKSVTLLKAMMYLACNSDRMCHAKDIATELDVSLSFINQQLYAAKSAGLLFTARGSDGGYKLAKPAKDITLCDIFLVYTENFNMKFALQHKRFTNDVYGAVIAQYYTKMFGEFYININNITLQDLVSELQNVNSD